LQKFAAPFAENFLSRPTKFSRPFLSDSPALLLEVGAPWTRHQIGLSFFAIGHNLAEIGHSFPEIGHSFSKPPTVFADSKQFFQQNFSFERMHSLSQWTQRAETKFHTMKQKVTQKRTILF